MTGYEPESRPPLRAPPKSQPNEKLELVAATRRMTSSLGRQGPQAHKLMSMALASPRALLLGSPAIGGPLNLTAAMGRRGGST